MKNGERTNATPQIFPRAPGRPVEGESREAESAGRDTAEDTQRLVHELRVHQIELELQNEEFRRRARIGAGLQRYSDLYDFAPTAT